MYEDIDDMYEQLLKPAPPRKKILHTSTVPSYESLHLEGASGRTIELKGGIGELHRNGWQFVARAGSGKTISGGDRRNAYKIIPEGFIPEGYEPRQDIPPFLKVSYRSYPGGLIRWHYRQENIDGTISERDELADPHPVNIKRKPQQSVGT